MRTALSLGTCQAQHEVRESGCVLWDCCLSADHVEPDHGGQGGRVVQVVHVHSVVHVHLVVRVHSVVRAYSVVHAHWAVRVHWAVHEN